MMKALCCALGVAIAGVAHADESATLVINSLGQGRFNRVLPAGVPVKIDVPVADADPTKGVLTIYPRSIGGLCADPGEDGKQRQQYGMSVTGSTDGRILEATISPLQISTVYCIQVSYEHGLSTDKLNKLSDMLAATPIDWAGTCSTVEHVSGHIQHSSRTAAEQSDTVRAAIERQLTESLRKLQELATQIPTQMNSQRVTADAPAQIHQAAVVLTDLLDVRSQCFAINARLGDEDLASAEMKSAATKQRKLADSVKALHSDARSWPSVVVVNGTAAVAMRLVDAINSTITSPEIAHVELADHQLAVELAELANAAASDAPAKRAKLRAQLESPPAASLPIVIYLPSAGKSVKASDLFSGADFDTSLIPDLVKNRDAIIRQLELLQDKPTADAWVAALSGLADQAAAAVDATQHYREASKARADAEAAIGASIKLLVQSDTMKGQLRKTEMVRDTPRVALRGTDDNASWIAPTFGVMVAAPFLTAEGQFADPWLVPYVGASVYFTRVDRVIDVDDLVGRPCHLFWQQNSFSLGLLLSRPSLRDKQISGPWKADIVPFLGFGHRFTQYLRADIGGIVFQYSDRVPVITDLHWGVAGWLGVSIDADVWAVFSGKLGK